MGNARSCKPHKPQGACTVQPTQLPQAKHPRPQGIPTSIEITTHAGEVFDSGLVMYPSGHARNTTADLEGILGEKMRRMGEIALADPGPVVDRFRNVGSLDAAALAEVHNFILLDQGPYE